MGSFDFLSFVPLYLNFISRTLLKCLNFHALQLRSFTRTLQLRRNGPSQLHITRIDASVFARSGLSQAARELVLIQPKPACCTLSHEGKRYFVKYFRKGKVFAEHEQAVVKKLNDFDGWQLAVSFF